MAPWLAYVKSTSSDTGMKTSGETTMPGTVHVLDVTSPPAGGKTSIDVPLRSREGLPNGMGEGDIIPLGTAGSLLQGE
jgi:hypothetical protein